MSSRTFADLGASSAVVTALAERGFDQPFPVQTLVVPDVLAGRDVLVKSPTGSGKTLAFGVPLVDRIEATDPRPSALVLVPTRELAGQIVEELRTIAHARALSIAAVYGGAGIERQSKLAKRAHILVATPGRLEDLIERRAVRLDQIKTLILDEADRMLDMGFRPAVDRIVQAHLARPSDALLQRHARRRRRRDRRRVHHRRAQPRARARRPSARRTSATASCPSPTSPSSTRSCASCARPTMGAAGSCSCAPSTVPTGSSSGCASTTSRRSRCTATRPSRSARRRSPASSAATSTRSSPPTSRPAGSTSTTSPT